MMKLYMKQKVFSFKQDFNIYDENQQPVFHVKGKLFSWGRQLSIQNATTGEELAFIKQRVFNFLTKMDIFREDQLVATVAQKFTFFKPSFEIREIGWEIEGDFWGYNYVIKEDKGNEIAHIRQKVFAWSDTFEFEIDETEVDVVTVMAVILAIDANRDAGEGS